MKSPISLLESKRYTKCNIDSEQVRENPRNDSKDSLGRDCAMRRREHYREWLGLQSIIDSIRNAEIEENGLGGCQSTGFGSETEAYLYNMRRTLADPVPLYGHN